MWRGSRHIIRVERGRSAPPASIIYGISSGGWRGEVTTQPLVGGSVPTLRPIQRSLCLPSTAVLRASAPHCARRGLNRRQVSASESLQGIRNQAGASDATPYGTCTGSTFATATWWPSSVAHACTAAARVPIASAVHSLDRSPPAYDCPWRLVLVEQTRRYAGAAATGCAGGRGCGASQGGTGRSSVP